MRRRALAGEAPRLLVLLCLFARIGRGFPVKDQKLVETLRRKLMNDNYDYMEESGESDQLTTRRPLAANELPTMRAEVEDEADAGPWRGPDDNVNPIRDSLPEIAPVAPAEPASTITPTVSAVHITSSSQVIRVQQQLPSIPIQQQLPSIRVQQQSPSISVQHKDLHYYVDDNLLNNNPSNNEIMNEFVADTPSDDTITTVRYKLLKVPDDKKWSGRRSGSLGALGALGGRRFLQEEKPDHISIMNLSGGPFPEFRLPRERRQYMEDNDSDEQPDASSPQWSDPDLAAIFSSRSTPPPPARLHHAPNPEPANHKYRRFSNSIEDDLIYLAQEIQ